MQNTRSFFCGSALSLFFALFFALRLAAAPVLLSTKRGSVLGVHTIFHRRTGTRAAALTAVMIVVLFLLLLWLTVLSRARASPSHPLGPPRTAPAQDSFVGNLRLRFAKDIIYTYIGEVLVCVNPYRDLGLYADALLPTFRHKALYQARVPHGRE